MSAAEKIVPVSDELLSWAAICERHVDEWVFLVDVEDAADGAIRAARVIGHDRSMRQALARLGAVEPGTAVMHTAGRPLRLPRNATTDEIRDGVRARR
jgi:hypothetical protein